MTYLAFSSFSVANYHSRLYCDHRFDYYEPFLYSYLLEKVPVLYLCRQSMPMTLRRTHNLPPTGPSKFGVPKTIDRAGFYQEISYMTRNKANRKLPPSLPVGWPRPSAVALEQRPQRKIYLNSSGQQEYSFCSNVIKTSRYGLCTKTTSITLTYSFTKEIWNFLPKFLLEEFDPRTKIANCYFLLIAGLQCIAAISNTSGYPTVLIPLSVVLTISGVFKASEDIARHKADKLVIVASSCFSTILSNQTLSYNVTGKFFKDRGSQ